jgi:predicted ATPase
LIWRLAAKAKRVEDGDVIASVSFRRFKALRETSLALAPFNLVIGPNGSGKTSLIQVLMALRTLSKLPLAEGELKTGGPEIEFGFWPPHDAVRVRLGCVSDYVCDLLHVAPTDAPDWPAVRERLAHVRAYLFDHYAMAEASAAKSGAELVSNGGNLAAVLLALKARAPAEFAAFTAEVMRLLPEFRAMELTEREGGRVELAMRLDDGGLVSADNLSQGTLYLLGMLALAFDPDPPTVLCIEEIDRGIHPRMLREVRDALYRLSYPQAFGLGRHPVQVIATTHSPYLLDLFRDHPEEIVIAQKHGSVARFERLVDRPDVTELLSEGSLGDMWFSGILGGVPEER